MAFGSVTARGAGFNPRLRAGGDEGEIARSKKSPYVSIHASAREATVFRLFVPVVT